MMGSFINNLFAIFGIISAILTALFLIFSFGFIIYVEIYSDKHLIRYDGTPCQNKIIKLSKPMKQGIAKESTFHTSFHSVTNFILQDIDEDWVTITETNQRYYQDSKFKILNYYRAYTTYPISGVGGNVSSGYLVKSMETQELSWILSSDFNVQECNICDSFEGNGTSVPHNFRELNITETEIEI